MPVSPAYLDECRDQHLLLRLRLRGFVVASAHTENLLGADDDQQLAFAVRRGWVLISHNKRHFQRLHAAYLHQGRTHSGIVILPQTPPLARQELRAAMMLDWLSLLPTPPASLYVWNDVQLWLAHGGALSGYSDDDLRLILGR